MEEQIIGVVIEEVDSNASKFKPTSDDILMIGEINEKFYGWTKDKNGNLHYKELNNQQILTGVAAMLQYGALNSGFQTFVEKPISSYKENDLWETREGIYKAITTKGDFFHYDDWELVLPYTYKEYA